MSRLVLDLLVKDKYDKTQFKDLVRRICDQVNQLSEGKLVARYAAQSVVPNSTAVAYAVGDITWDSQPTVTGSVAPGVAASYVRLGWVCTAPGTGDVATFREIRTLTGS